MPPEFSDGTRRRHPHLVVSTDSKPPAGIVVTCPVTTSRARAGDDSRFVVELPLSELTWTDKNEVCSPSQIVVRHVRSISLKRLTSKAGSVSAKVLREVEAQLEELLELCR